MEAGIVEWLNGGVGTLQLFDDFMEAMVNDYLVPVFGSLVLVGLWFSGDGTTRFANQLVTITGTMAIGFANGLTAAVNGLWSRDRPFVDSDLELLFYRPTDSSFPANVAAVGFGLATAVFPRHERSKAIGIWTGALIGIVAALAAALVVRWLGFVPRRVLGIARKLYLA